MSAAVPNSAADRDNKEKIALFLYCYKDKSLDHKNRDALFRGKFALMITTPNRLNRGVFRKKEHK